jgi:maltose-binding protein MalE
MGFSYQAKLYALPFYGESSMLMYRKDLLEEKGLKMSEQPKYEDTPLPTWRIWSIPWVFINLMSASDRPAAFSPSFLQILLPTFWSRCSLKPQGPLT